MAKQGDGWLNRETGWPCWEIGGYEGRWVVKHRDEWLSREMGG